MALTAVFLAGLTAGCDSSNDETPKASRPPATPSAMAPAAPQPAGQRALEVYRKMWDAAVRMKATSDYQAPEIALYAEEQALGYFRATAKNDFERGLVVKGQPVLTPQVVEEQAQQARLIDCLDASNWLKYWVTSGRLEDNVPGGRHHVEAEVVLAGSVWKVRRLVVEETGTC